MRVRNTPEPTHVLVVGLFSCLLFTGLCRASDTNSVESDSIIAIEPNSPYELLRFENQSSSVRIVPSQMNQQTGLAVRFEGTDDLHYYAKSETSPAPGYNLQVRAQSEVFNFGQAVYPQWKIFTDSLGNKVEVYVGRFDVFVPLADDQGQQNKSGRVEVRITGIACTSMVCLPPFVKTFVTTADFSRPQTLAKISYTEEEPSAAAPTVATSSRAILFAFALAFVAGLALNIMPCVWPVLPLIVMRIVTQAKQRRAVSIAMGLAFCLGILLFFAILAGANIILQVFYGTVLQWGDQFRNPAFVAGMVLLLVLMALFMFGVFSITVPSSISSKQSSGVGYLSAVGMGLLAAVLSTPCSFGILAAAFAWAQAQTLFMSITAIMIIGVGMALPYAILTSMPRLLNRLPRPGRWMELFKQAIGFILLVIAVKLVLALPETLTTGVLYFAVVLAFCAWMWGTWVEFGTRPLKKWTVRLAAVVLAFLSGWLFLSPAQNLIAWQPYNAAEIQTAMQQDRPVLIDFTADWCLSCQAVDKTVYSRKDIAELIKEKNVLAIKADTTESDFPAAIALKDFYKEPGVPVSMLFVPGREGPLKWRGIFFGDELGEQLQKLKVTKIQSE